MSKNTELMTLDFQEMPVRILSDNKGQPLFVLNDVCKVLEISNPHNVAARLPEDCLHTMEVTDAIGRPRQTNVVTLKGLNRVILDSRKPELDAFKDWVADVITTLQTTGKVDLTKKFDLNQPQSHLLGDARKQLNKNINGIAFAHSGSKGCRDIHMLFSQEFFGDTPKKVARQIQEESGKKVASSKSLPQVLSENNQPLASSYSYYKNLRGRGMEKAKALEVADAYEQFAQVALEAGESLKNLL